MNTLGLTNYWPHNKKMPFLTKNVIFTLKIIGLINI